MDKRKEYRVVSQPNAGAWIAQSRVWWWPFWMTEGYYHDQGELPLFIPYEFSTEALARDHCIAAAESEAVDQGERVVVNLGRLP